VVLSNYSYRIINVKLIGIGGTNGSGKDTVSTLLAEKYGWLFISGSRDFLIPELKKRGLALERENMRALSAEWRRRHGLGVVIDKAVERYDPKKHQGLVISSLRNFGEADRVHELGGKVVWTDGDPKIRYQRIYGRGQGDKDQKTFEQFLAEEKAEMQHSDNDAATLNWAGVKDRADIFITNDDNDIEKFKARAEKALGLS
jgi:cytidylate kinase